MIQPYPADIHASQLRPGDELQVQLYERPRSYELQVVRRPAVGFVELIQVLYRSRNGERCCARARRQGWRGNGRQPASLPMWPDVGQVEPEAS